jgi:hypothetical protein
MDEFSSPTFYGTLIILYVCGTIASAGGIGGGGVNVPLLLAIAGYSYHKSTIFSLCTVLGNYIAQTSINIQHSHPHVPKRPLIYWDIILFLLPAQLGGSNLGVIIHSLFPDRLLLICAIIVLVMAIYKTYFKFWYYYHEEQIKHSRKTAYQKLMNFANQVCCEHSYSGLSLHSPTGERDNRRNSNDDDDEGKIIKEREGRRRREEEQGDDNMEAHVTIDDSLYSPGE